MQAWIRRYPIRARLAGAAAFLIALFSALGAVEGVWGLFSDRPLLPLIYDNVGSFLPELPRVAVIIVWLVPAVIGGAMVVGVFIATRPRSSGEIDYWRCPDGRLHQWRYWRGPRGEGVYMCENCPTQVTKAALKAHTDYGPPPTAVSSTYVEQTGARLPPRLRQEILISPSPWLPNRDALARAIANFRKMAIDLMYAQRQQREWEAANPLSMDVKLLQEMTKHKNRFNNAHDTLTTEMLVAGKDFRQPVEDFMTLVFEHLELDRPATDMASADLIETSAEKAIQRLDEIAGGNVSSR